MSSLEWSTEIVVNAITNVNNGANVFTDGISGSDNVLWLPYTGTCFGYITDWSNIRYYLRLWTNTPNSFDDAFVLSNYSITRLSINKGSNDGYRAYFLNTIAVQCDDPYIK